MITTCATFSLFGPAGAGWLSCGVSEQVGLLERRGLTKVAQALKAPDVPRQGVLADATPPSPLRLAQGAQARRALRVDVTTRVCLLRLLPARRPGALHRALAAGRGGGAPPPRVPGPVGGLLARLDRASSGRGEDDGPRARRPTACLPPRWAGPLVPAVCERAAAATVPARGRGLAEDTAAWRRPQP